MTLHQHEQRVPARHEQHHEWELELWIFEEGGIEMRFEVVDGEEGHVPREGERLGRRHAHQQRTHEAGPVRGRDSVDGADLAVHGPIGKPSLDEGLRHHRHDEIDVGAAGDLGHHAPVAGMEIHLAAHHGRQHRGPRLDDGGGRLVTGGLDAQDAPSADLDAHGPSSSRTVAPGTVPSSAANRSA